MFKFIRNLSNGCVVIVATFLASFITFSVSAAADEAYFVKTDPKRLEPSQTYRSATNEVSSRMPGIAQRSHYSMPVTDPPVLTKLSYPGSTYFGFNVELSGDTALVGSQRLITGSAVTYHEVFVRGPKGWSHQSTISPPSGDNFTRESSISGDTAVIVGGDSSTTQSVFVFVRDEKGVWTQQQKIPVPLGPFSIVQFINSIAISGDTLVFDTFDPLAPFPNDNYRQVTYVYVRNGTLWTEQQRLLGDSFEDRFGVSAGAKVAISGDTLIVSRYDGTGEEHEHPGQASVWVRNGTSWTRQQILVPSESYFYDSFGSGVSISGDTAVIGATSEDDDDPLRSAAYVFVRNGSVWTQQKKLVPSARTPRDYFGSDVVLVGDTVIIAAPLDDINGQINQGSIYVYSRCGDDWTEVEKITADDGFQYNLFGAAIAMSGDTILMGAPSNGLSGFDYPGFAYTGVLESPLRGGAQCQTGIIVNVNTDEPDDDLTDEICDIDTATPEKECSLRAAIETANAVSGTDFITFDIPGGGVQTITPSDALPPITERVFINGTTQPGYQNMPMIEVSGLNVNGNGLVFAVGSNGSSIRALTINRFGDSGILIQGNDVTIERSFIGILADGMNIDATRRQQYGVTITGARNKIGGERSGPETGPNCIVAGSSVGQVLITGASAVENSVVGSNINFNFLGETPTVPDAADDGIQIRAGATMNTIGGNELTLRNLIHGSLGVFIEDSDENSVINSVIAGCATGVGLIRAANNIIGGTASPEDGHETNSITENGFGIFLSDSPGAFNLRAIKGSLAKGARKIRNRQAKRLSGGESQTVGNKIYGNLIGIRLDTDPVGKYGNDVGVLIDEASGNVVGSEENGFFNQISGNSEGGVIMSVSATGNNILRNFIGMNIAGNAAHPNLLGVLIEGSNNLVKLNTIVGNTEDGIRIEKGVPSDPFPTLNTLDNNRIGITQANVTIPNLTGISVLGRQTTVDSNVVSGNSVAGIFVEEDDNIIRNNRIGTNIAGDEPRPNNDFGIMIFGSRNVLTSNTVSGNGGGITISRSDDSPKLTASNNVLKKNKVGVNFAGTAALPGQVYGIVLANGASDNVIGGTEIGDGNIVSGNTLDGINIQLGLQKSATPPSQNKIQGNFIGTDIAGTTAIPNGQNGIGIFSATSTLIGSFGAEIPGARNVVSGNLLHGIFLHLASGNRISGNYIGTAADGTSPLGNIRNGIFLATGVGSTKIGGLEPNAGNTIAYNGKNGILLAADAGNNNIIDPNKIFGNTLYGIDIGDDGPTPNDPTDADVGPNNLQNYPVITTKQIVDDELILTFNVDSAPEHSAYGKNGIYIEFFKSDLTGQGEMFIGSTYYTLADYNSLAPGAKTVNLGPIVTLGINPNDPITSTATDADGNTSEFSPVAFGPTAAGVMVSGRVFTAAGTPLRGTTVTITDDSGVTRTAVTSSLGYYAFEGVQAGRTYVVTAVSRRYRFTPRIVNVADPISDLDLIALE